MTSALSLFPSRVRIADAQGMATPEFLRALQVLFTQFTDMKERGLPVILQPFAEPEELAQMLMQAEQADEPTTIVMQPQEAEGAATVVQQQGTDPNPVFESVTVTGTLDVGGTTTLSGDLNVAGAVKFGTHTGSADAPVTGYVTITDTGGTPRKLAVIA